MKRKKKGNLAHLPENFKAKTKAQLLLNGKEAENSSVGNLNSNLVPACLSLNGDP